MKSIHILFLRAILGVFLLGSFAFGDCTLTLNPTSMNIREGNTARIAYSATCTNRRYHIIAYRTVPNSATAGDDYTSLRSTYLERFGIYGGWVLARPGSFQRSASDGIDVNAIADNVTEGDERYRVEFRMYEYYSRSWHLINSSQKETTVTIKDAQPVVVHVDTTTVYEGETAKIRIYATGIPSGESIDVHYYTADGSATSSTNYNSTSGDITLSSSNPEKIINVVTLNDGVNNPSDLLYRMNARLPNGNVSYNDQRIKNVEGVSIGFTKDTYTGDEGTTLRFVVESSGLSPHPIRVRYKTSNGTADGADYAVQNSTFDIPANVTSSSKTIEIPLTLDSVTENSENFHITLSFDSPPTTQTTFSKKQATGIINDVNPNQYTVEFTKLKYTGNEGENLIFSVTINRRPTSDIRVRFETSSSTAARDLDYTHSTGYINFTPSGSLTQNISVPLLTDTEDEFDEDFFVTLSSNNTDIRIPNPQATGVIKGKEFDDEDVIDENVICSGSLCRSTNLQRNFQLRFGGPGYAAYGDMTATGESVICPGSHGSCQWYSTTTVENQSTTKINEASFAKNSSYAPLILPNDVNKGEHIAFARLYWQGFISELSATNKNTLKGFIKNWSKIKFQTPDGVNHTLNAKKADTNWMGFWGKGGRFAYQASVDVTNIVKNYIDSDTFQNTHKKRFAAGDIVTTSEGGDGQMVYHSLRSGQKFYTNVQWGHWGGWTLIVSYDMKKPIASMKYKNIAIYDGYTYLAPWFDKREDKVEIGVTGFRTPSSGPVDASMTLFAGSGNGPLHKSNGYFELYNPINNQWNSVSNTLNPYGQPLNGSYTYKNTPLNANRKNHAATDLDTFDVSSYMSNAQQSANLRIRAIMASNNYAYASTPSMLAFSTEIYSPKVCYEEHIFYGNTEIDSATPPPLGSTLTTKLEIRNEGHEYADKIRLDMSFDQNYSYEDNSVLVGNVGSDYIPAGGPTAITTPAPAGPLVANSPLAKVTPNSVGESDVSINLGRGANSSDGGVFMAMKSSTPSPYEGDSARVDYNMTFHVKDFVPREYNVYYVNTDLGITYDGQIYECEESNRSFSTGLLGNFNAVSKRIPSGAQLSSDPDTAKTQSVNSLYTKIAGKEFNVWIASLKDSDSGNKKELNDFTGGVDLDLVKAINYTSCGSVQDYNSTCVEKKCKNVSNANKVTSTISQNPLIFNNQKQKEVRFRVNSATYPVMVRMKYQDEQNKTRCATSVDTFVVRPASYAMDLNETTHIANRKYEIDINATRGNGNNIAKGYAKVGDPVANADINISRNAKVGCGIADNANDTIDFSDGQSVGVNVIQTGNVGDYNITIKDTKWTLSDQIKKSDDSIDCIANSNVATEDSNGKVGCNIQATKTFAFSPKAFRIVNTRLNNAHAANPAVANDVNFTYVSPPNPITGRTYPNMRATFTFDIEAVMDYNATTSIYAAPIATAYDGTCSAYNTDINVSLIKASADWSDDDRNITDYIIYDGDGASTFFLNAADGNATLRTNNTNFTAGIANIVVPFNFDRNISKPLEPFDVNKTDFNITVMDVAGVKGSDFNRTDLNNPTATFYFGRLWSPDRVGPLPSLTTIFRYEVYCNALDLVAPCDNARWGFGSINLVDSKWRLNENHRIPAPGVIGDGNIPANPTFNDPAGMGATQITRNNANNLTNGVESNVVITANPNSSYTTQLVTAPSRWLSADNPNASLSREEFLDTGNWSGAGNLGQVVTENNISTRRNNRMEW